MMTIREGQRWESKRGKAPAVVHVAVADGSRIVCSDAVTGRMRVFTADSLRAGFNLSREP